MKPSSNPVKLAVPEPVSTEIEEKIRHRAYVLYEQRGQADGYALEDWLKAEAEVVGSKREPVAAERKLKPSNEMTSRRGRLWNLSEIWGEAEILGLSPLASHSRKAMAQAPCLRRNKPPTLACDSPLFLGMHKSEPGPADSGPRASSRQLVVNPKEPVFGPVRKCDASSYDLSSRFLLPSRNFPANHSQPYSSR